VVDPYTRQYDPMLTRLRHHHEPIHYPLCHSLEGLAWSLGHATLVSTS